MAMPQSLSNQQSAASGVDARVQSMFDGSGFTVNYGNTVPWYVWAGLAVAGYLWWKKR